MSGRSFWITSTNTATAEACGAILERGHRRTLYLGYRTVVGRNPGAGWVERVAPGLVRDALEAGVTGLLCQNERLTAQWIAVAQALGYRWPDDYGFAVLGDPIHQDEWMAGRMSPSPAWT